MRSSTLPCVMRDTSSRSSTIRTMCVDLAVEHLPRLGVVCPRSPSGAAHDLQREAHRRQRISQFVRQDAEELVLAPVDQAQRFRVDAQRFGLTRVGDVLDGQQERASAGPSRTMAPCVQHQRPRPRPGSDALDLQVRRSARVP